jgi:hypothetical protein
MYAGVLASQGEVLHDYQSVSYRDTELETENQADARHTSNAVD